MTTGWWPTRPFTRPANSHRFPERLLVLGLGSQLGRHMPHILWILALWTSIVCNSHMGESIYNSNNNWLASAPIVLLPFLTIFTTSLLLLLTWSFANALSGREGWVKVLYQADMKIRKAGGWDCPNAEGGYIAFPWFVMLTQGACKNEQQGGAT